MKNLIIVFLLIFVTSCSSTNVMVYKKPTHKEIKKAMRYSDWRYVYPTKIIHSNYLTYPNYDK